LIVICQKKNDKEKRPMCHVSAGKQVLQMNTMCDCGCTYGCRCEGVIPIEDEIRILEDHKKILKDRIDIIDKKITGLKSVNES
jgi:hypothetical protein